MKRLIAFLMILLAVQGEALPPFQRPGFVRNRAAAAASCSTSRESKTGATVGSYEIDTYVMWASKFTASATYTACKVVARASQSGASGTVRAAIYTDSSGAPGTLVGTASSAVNQSSFGGSEGDVAFTGMSASLTSGTTYWMVIDGQTGSASSAAPYYSYTSAGITVKGFDGVSTWDDIGTDESLKYTIYSN